MAVILVTPDPFTGTLDKFSSYIPSLNGVPQTRKDPAGIRALVQQELDNVRRPISGISVKPDTPAYVQILDSAGNPFRIFNNLPSGAPTVTSSQSLVESIGATVIPSNAQPPTPNTPINGPNATIWTDWLLQSVDEERVEKTQVFETFGTDFFYAFGQKARALRITAILLNTQDFNWRSVFTENWDRFFRATKLVEMDARAYLTFDDIIVEGYPLNTSLRQIAGDDNKIMASFTLFLTNYTNIAAATGFNSFTGMHAQSNVLRSTANNYDGGLVDFSSRKSVIELLGYQGFGIAGSKVEEGIRALNGTKDGEEDADAAMVGSGIAQLLSTVASGGMAALAGQASAAAFLQAFVMRSAYTGLTFGMNMAIDMVENDLNLKRGEVNQWFGFVASIVESLATSDYADVSSALNKSSVATYLRAGSALRLVQGMSYAIADAVAGGIKASPTTMGRVDSYAFDRVGGFGISG